MLQNRVAFPAPPKEIGRNPFDEWCWRRGLDLREPADALGVSIETVRKIRMPFSDPRRRVPSTELIEKIKAYTGGEIGPWAFYPPHLAGEVRS